MKAYIAQHLQYSVAAQLESDPELAATDCLTQEARHMLPSRRLLIIDRLILVSVHDRIDTNAGEHWDNYRSTLNL